MHRCSYVENMAVSSRYKIYLYILVITTITDCLYVIIIFFRLARLIKLNELNFFCVTEVM